MPQSNLMLYDVSQIAEWDIAHRKYLEDTKSYPAKVPELDYAMWAAFKLGYKRARQEIQSTCKSTDLNQVVNFMEDLAGEYGWAPEEVEAHTNARQLAELLSIEPRFEP